MNGFATHGLDESSFNEKSGGGLRTFDAFRKSPKQDEASALTNWKPKAKTKSTYTRRTTGGGFATITLVALSCFLAMNEFKGWYRGQEAQQFSVEKGVSHTMQVNIDAVVAMRCADLHINVQDASGDRILAGELLTKEPTSWGLWVNPAKIHHQSNKKDRKSREATESEDTHVGHVIGEVRKSSRKFPKSPSMKRGAMPDACRIYGSLEGNKVQGDFHITARGHGYQEFGEHLSHDAFNFTHLISELSFGPLYPSLLNPLDHTLARTKDHFNRFQYYLSIVPTIYTRSQNPTLPSSSDPQAQVAARSRDTIFTNQYAVTQSSMEVPENQIPGIFFKYDIEPILLMVSETRDDLLYLIVRIVNVISGIMVGGGWIYQLWGWSRENFSTDGSRRRANFGDGMLNGRKEDIYEGRYD